VINRPVLTKKQETDAKTEWPAQHAQLPSSYNKCTKRPVKCI